MQHHTIDAKIENFLLTWILAAQGSDYPAAMTKNDAAATLATEGDRLSSGKLQITSHVSARDFN